MGMVGYLMRHSVIVFLILFTSLSVLAQHGNEWINYSQPYFKIPTAQNAIYKLTYGNLVAAGVPSAIDPRSIRIYHRGIEQAIYVDGETDGVLNNTDFVEFYGLRNDGTEDEGLYTNPASQPHKYYNLYSDTTSYFLTFGSGQGKRMNFTSQANPGLAPENFHWEEKLVVLTSQYSYGIDFGSVIQTYFDVGEGWMGNQILHGQTGSYLVDGITNTYTSDSAPTIEILLTGRGLMEHAVELYAGARLLTTINFSGYNSYKHTQSLQWTDISGDGKITLNVKVIGVSGSPDRVSVGYINVRYPQTIDLDNAAAKNIFLAANAGGTSYIEMADAPGGTRLFDVTNADNVSRIGVVSGTTLNAVVPSTTSPRKLLASSTALTPAIKHINFRQISPALHDFIIITHPSLRKPASGYTDPVKAYGEYRSLPAGGGYDTLIVNVTDLYDQFNFGEQSPVAIYRFMKFLHSVHPPKYLFIIGKGLDVDYHYYRTPNLFSSFKDLVPSAGFPGSDIAFTAGLSGSAHVPAVATGRLTATAPQDVAAYLNKVKAMEALPFDDLRRKNILHLSGGIYEGEPQIFQSYLKNFGTIAENVHLGGKVHAIAKQTTNQEVINVADELNAGLNLITFFGHSATNSTDFDIGNVTDPVLGYNNKGKYPLLVMNGCYAGSVFLNASIFGENWVNTPDKGAIGVVAHSSLAFAGALRNYTSMFYSLGYGDPLFINKGIGDIQKEVASRYLTEFLTSPQAISQVQQMVLLGDPAYRLFGAGKPDFEIKEEGISVESFNAEPITALLDSFKLNVIVKNFGIASDQNLKVTVTRKFADNSTVSYDSVFDAVLYSDTLSFSIPGEKEKGFGINTFTITVDSDNTFEELREDNNEISYAYFIPLSRTQNLFPDNFSIVSSQTVNLTFQHTDMLADERDFLLEIDTVDTFTSGYKKQFQVKGEVLATHPHELLANDTLTYYWRTKLLNALPNESNEWDLSSFTYIHNGPEGWAQTHFPQFKSNVLDELVSDPQIRRLEYKETVTDIAVKTFGAASGKPVDSVSFKINGAEYNLYIDFGCRNNTINLIAFDKKTTQPYPGVYITWSDLFFLYGNKRLVCGREPYVINSYQSDELIMGNDVDIIKYVDNVPAGDSVVIFNIGDAGYASWPAAAKTKLGELGISVAQIDQLQPGEPVIIFARKGTPAGSAKIVKATSGVPNEQRIAVKETVTGRSTSGSMQSSLIGPAQSWNQFLVRVTEKESNDVVHFDIIGVNESGGEDVLKSDLTDDTDISDIDASAYPHLKIIFKSEDNTFTTSSQLKNWLVTYEPVAEGVVLYPGDIERQTLFEGQKWNAGFRFVNISNKNFSDSLTVQYDIVNPTTSIKTEQSKRIKAPLPADTVDFQLSFPTVNQDGLNDVEVFVNPRMLIERRYDNNIISLRDKIFVQSDPNDPVLDVLFDGRHILDKEFVSSSPQIDITLWDENPYLLKTDTLGMKIFLASPCVEDDCVLMPVYFSGGDIQWSPATETSEFKIEFTPQNLQDGNHKLRVEASDANGNKSDTAPFEINFQVKSEESVVISRPYPNPFYYQTIFEFVLTGDVLPDKLNLQIISLKGEIVQEFTEADVTDFHVGRNQIFWNGIDSNGRALPTGIYLYRFTVGEVLKSGKLVLMR